ncbi:hypothetical protein D0O09_31860 [Pseudomonas putida]|nr:hypothetical protein D0O09_31860 [Pseudomonas putida]
MPVDYLKIDGSFRQGHARRPGQPGHGRGHQPYRSCNGQAHHRRIRRNNP